MSHKYNWVDEYSRQLTALLLTTTVMTAMRKYNKMVLVEKKMLKNTKFKFTNLRCDRTRNRKQSQRKWSGKEISFQVVPKNSRHWSQGDVGWQTVPEAAQTSSRLLGKKWVCLWLCTIMAHNTVQNSCDYLPSFPQRIITTQMLYSRWHSGSTARK